MTRPQHSEFLVIGGGIGGLSAALALAREGRQVRVLERAPVFGELGAGLHVAPNAARALDRLGVLSDVERDAFFPTRLVLRDGITCEPITALETGELFVERFGYRYFVAHRADLHRALQRACEDSGLVELLASKNVLHVEPRRGGALVVCADDSRYETVALIAADGLHSATRAILVGEAAPVDSGFVAYRGTVPTRSLAEHGGLREPDGMVVWVGPGLHLVQYPLRRGELINQVASFDTHRYPADDDISHQLDSVFAHACSEVANGLALMDRTRRWQLMDRAPVSGWSRDTITMVGDAAHPMLRYLGQGACQAIEDSVVLADSVTARPDDIEAAFTAYESLRSPARPGSRPRLGNSARSCTSTASAPPCGPRSSPSAPSTTSRSSTGSTRTTRRRAPSGTELSHDEPGSDDAAAGVGAFRSEPGPVGSRSRPRMRLRG